jgi:aryl-alcohol dehydrogenase-like predicted oxidoreductase
MSFGNPAWESWVMNEAAALPIIEHAYKAGINTWDTVGYLFIDASGIS